MGLGEVQRGLAMLLTNGELCERFLSDAHSVSQTLQLDAGNAAELARLAGAEVERFARSLRAKRWNEIQRLLPLSTRAAQSIGFPLRLLFLQYAQAVVPQGSKRHAQDAIAFADWMARQPKEKFLNSPKNAPAENAFWLPDLLRYEAAWLEMQITPSRRGKLLRLAYPIPNLARVLSLSSAQNVLPAEFLSPRATLCIWMRPPFQNTLITWSNCG